MRPKRFLSHLILTLSWCLKYKIRSRWEKFTSSYAFHASRQVRENSELFKKLEPGSQFQCVRISSIDQLSRSMKGSEAEPTTSSRYSSFQNQERSLDPERLRRALRHSRTNDASSLSLRQPSVLESDLRRGKEVLVFRFHTVSINKDQPKYASLSANQWFSRSGIPRTPLLGRWQQTCLRTIGLWPLQSNLERGRWSASRWFLGRGSSDKR